MHKVPETCKLEDATEAQSSRVSLKECVQLRVTNTAGIVLSAQLGL